MPSLSVGRDRSSRLVSIAEQRIEAQLLARRRGGYGVDLDTDPADATKADLILALAAERLVKKYNNQLVISRYRGNISISWRDSTFAGIGKETQEKLLDVGFFGGAGMTLDEMRTGSNANNVSDPRDPHHGRRLEAARRQRVAIWVAGGWQGDPGSEAGGTPREVAVLRDAMRKRVRDGKINIGGVDVAWVEPKLVVAP